MITVFVYYTWEYLYDYNIHKQGQLEAFLLLNANYYRVVAGSIQIIAYVLFTIVGFIGAYRLGRHSGYSGFEAVCTSLILQAGFGVAMNLAWESVNQHIFNYYYLDVVRQYEEDNYNLTWWVNVGYCSIVVVALLFALLMFYLDSGEPNMVHMLSYTGNSVTIRTPAEVYDVVEQVLAGASILDKYVQKYNTCLQRCKGKLATKYTQIVLEGHLDAALKCYQF